MNSLKRNNERHKINIFGILLSIILLTTNCGRSIVLEDNKDGSVSGDAINSDSIFLDGINTSDGQRIRDYRLQDKRIVKDGPRLDKFTPPDTQIIKDTVWVDFQTPDSFNSDLLPCQPSCQDLCKFIYGCFPNQPLPTCQTICSSIDQATQQCLAKAYCVNNGAPAPTGVASGCSMIQECINTNQEKPDLVINSFSSSVQGDSVYYTAQVCNLGKVKSGNFYIDVYYNRYSAPKVNDFGNKYNNNQGLSAGQCTKRTFTRTNTPPGKYRSWAQVDADNVVDESNESNNVAGPVNVVVNEKANGPDLVVQGMTTWISGANNDVVNYKIEVCNIGDQNSGATTIEVIYNRKTPPTIGFVGNQTIAVQPLAPSGATKCTVIETNRTSTPVGSYQSWAIVDSKNKVKESNEFNNIFGPQTVTVSGLAPLTCADICNFGIKCNEFSTSELNLCLTWCSGFTEKQFNCHVKATSEKNCNALSNCDKPPKPCVAPAGFCPDLCNYLVKSCYFPQDQWWTCIGACSSFCPEDVKCAKDAKDKNECMQVLMCLNS